MSATIPPKKDSNTPASASNETEQKNKFQGELDAANADQARQHEERTRANPTMEAGRLGGPAPMQRPQPPAQQPGKPEPIVPKAMRTPEFMPEHNPLTFPETDVSQHPNAFPVAAAGRPVAPPPGATVAPSVVNVPKDGPGVSPASPTKL